EGFLEVASRYPTQVENRQQRVEALRPLCPLRQIRRGKADFLLGAPVAPIAHLSATDFERPPPRFGLLDAAHGARHGRGHPAISGPSTWRQRSRLTRSAPGPAWGGRLHRLADRRCPQADGRG